MWPAGMTRPDIANAARAVARHSHNLCEHWNAAVKILAYLNSTRNLGITYKEAEEISLLVYKDADYDGKEIGRRSISGVAAT